jgi:hypothetical protein
VSRDFLPLVFSSNNPTWALINGLNIFAYGFEFAKVFDKVGAPAVSMTPLVLPQRIQLCKLGSKSHRTSGGWCHLSDVIGTAGAASAVSVTPLVRYDTAGAGDLEFERLWLPLKGISIEKTYIGKLYYPIAIAITQKI